MDVRLTTYKDLIEHALDYLGSNPGGDASRDARRAAQNALREFAAEKRWSYYYTRGRVVSNAPQNSGTIQYTQATRTATLTGATWPSWAAQGSISIAGGPGGAIVYQVASRTDDTNLILKKSTNPGADVAALTTYTLYQDTYPLPVDCLALDRVILMNNAFALWYEHPGVWLERQRIFYSPSTPRTYTIVGDSDLIGSMAISFFPPPDNAYNLDFIYHRRPRSLSNEAVTAGTVAVSNGGDTVTGTGTAWNSRLVGSVIRIGSDNTNAPTSRVGAYPAYFERVVMSVESATSLTVDAAFDQAFSGVKYVISDPIDIEEGAMLTALFRCVEKQTGISRDRKTLDRAEAVYREALIKAMEADSRNFAAERAGPSNPYPYRLAQMPRGSDVS